MRCAERALAALLASPALLLFAPLPVRALVADCRGPGSIGTATMSQDGTITLTISTANRQGAFAYRKTDPRYAQILAHLSGLRPGEHKPVPPWCGATP